MLILFMSYLLQEAFFYHDFQLDHSAYHVNSKSKLNPGNNPMDSMYDPISFIVSYPHI
jgi:hypothetical protein